MMNSISMAELNSDYASIRNVNYKRVQPGQPIISNERKGELLRESGLSDFTNFKDTVEITGNRFPDTPVLRLYDAQGKAHDYGVSGKSPLAELKDSPAVCKTCSERKYQDQSSDPGVSFQSASHIEASSSVGVVLGHEREHEVREAANAEENGRDVVFSKVSIQMEQCPECKKMYAAGGQTEVMTKGGSPAPVWAGFGDFADNKGRFLDMTA